MNHILNIDTQETELIEIFKNIRESNTILFLGAGASVGEKKYLSRELIVYFGDTGPVISDYAGPVKTRDTGPLSIVQY